MIIMKLREMKFKVEYQGETYYAKFEYDPYEFVTVKLYNYELFGKQINKGCEHVAHKFSGRENLINDAIWKYKINKERMVSVKG